VDSITEISSQEHVVVDSPDLGSPPVSQFRKEEAAVPEITSIASPDEEEKDPEPVSEELPLNIETRRRRRDSGKMSAKRVMIFNSSPTAPEEREDSTKASQDDVIARTSRKRKLSEQLGDSKDRKTWSRDDKEPFSFNSKSSRSMDIDPGSTKDARVSAKNEASSEGGAKSAPAPERKALSSSMKSPNHVFLSALILTEHLEPVNTDPVLSPKKSRNLLTDKPLKKSISTSAARDAARQRIRDRRITKDDAKALLSERRPSSTKPSESETSKPSKPTSDEIFSKVVKDPQLELPSLPPTTPATTESIFSPPSQLSTDSGRVASADTPPPGELSSSVNETTGRTARRARTAINYAEPNLISKMRRPTKELLDAVGKDGRPLQGAIVNKRDIEKPTSQWKPAYSASAGDVLVSEEAPSPLGAKRSAPLVETRSEEIANGSGVSAERQPSTTSTKGRKSSKTTSNTQSQTQEPKSDGARQAELAIFDFTDSSPSELKVLDVKSKGASSRRHTAIRDGVIMDNVEGSRTWTKDSVGRRKSMMV
jgi:Shugoshin C terminus